MLKTYLWRECPTMRGDKVYRIQTNDPKIHRKMSKRNKFTLVLYGINKNIWVYQTEFISLYKAKRTLGNLTGNKVKKDPVGGEFYA